MAMASASGFSLASASSTPVPAETVRLVTPVKTLSIRRPIGDAPEPELERPIVTASLGKYQAREPGYEQQMVAAPPADDAQPETSTKRPVPPRSRLTVDQVVEYLWEVYQRQPVKKDRGGDFSWKDPAAANRVGKTLQAYVIAGMDADFRELVYHAGKAMDAAGIEWTIVSGFRDDWRQSIASGLKARTGFSRHGGSQAVGGYGHGRAVDIGHIESSRSHEVFRWIDNNGAKFGLHRPYRFDPPHVEPRNDWRRLATKLRAGRTDGVATAETETHDATEDARPTVKRKVRNVRVASSARGNRPARKRQN
ncbi:MAG: D-alanyl-D-alanine carboxypeptidase family protein [Xanthobacteraceae bacterium]|nr:D-alanyl-D-alanine carboxypeptidase family protein [Xanthobacteraceae bacterium]